jgi:hypothetical protein
MSNFPEHALIGASTAASLFCAAFHGEQDVKYLHAAGIKRVLLVDTDVNKLVETAAKYDYSGMICDAFEFISRCMEQGRKFDVVVCDQWTNMDFKLWARYEDLKKITTMHLIIGVVQVNIDNGLTLPPGELVKRSDHLGGAYWHVTKI